MTPENWKKVKDVFNEAVEVSFAERADFLRQQFNADETEIRREVEKMLAVSDEDTTSDALEKNAFKIFTGDDFSKIPERIGGYKIIREIGRGGMGAVYEAVRETENFRQRAALKVIKRGMNTDAIVSRFRFEQKILASLEHPNIARFLDGGVTEDGLPFYAMEFVEGEFIDDYCEEKNLSVAEKLQLFREVCAAVSYAHQNLVIHRDLKPRNILVTNDGKPKLLDFGIGKILTSGETEEIGTATQFGMMTPAYASPEQIRGERIGTASDIYSLGVVLYELLTGEKPYKINSKSAAEIERAVLESEPTKPSSVQNSKFKIQNSHSALSTRHSALLKGDVDNIILKSLRKEPEQRYASAQEFSEDIRLYLEGQPIKARPQTFSYRASKFIKRNRIAVTAAALVILSLCAGITVSVWQAVRAERQKTLAEKRFAEVRQIANNVVYKYTEAISALPNSIEVREMLLRDASEYLDRLAQDSQNDLPLQYELGLAYRELGRVRGRPNSASLGDTAGAIESYEKAVPLLENVYRNASADAKEKIASELIALYSDVGLAFFRADLNTANRRLFAERRFEIINESAREFPGNIKFKIELAEIKVGEGRQLLEKDFEAGEKFYGANILPLIDEIRDLSGGAPEAESFAVGIYNELGWLYNERGKFMLEAEANREDIKRIFDSELEFARREEEIYKRRLAREPQSVKIKRALFVGMINVATAQYNLERFDESLEHFRQVQALSDEVIAFDRNNLQAVFDEGILFSELGLLYHRKKDYRAAENYFEKSLANFDRVISKDEHHHEAVYYKIEVLMQGANVFADTDRLEKASEFYRRAADLANAHDEENNDFQTGRIFLSRGRTLVKFSANDPALCRKASDDLIKALEIMKKTDSGKNKIQIEIIKSQAAKCGI